jgi:hypothetical protein
LGGVSGWRLPAVMELSTVVDFTGTNTTTTIDPVAFPNTPADLFWGSSPSAGSAGVPARTRAGKSSRIPVVELPWACEWAARFPFPFPAGC